MSNEVDRAPLKASSQPNWYNAPLRVLSVTPSKDGLNAPSRRLADKQIRLFHGRTLDEWTMVSMWSNRCVAHQVFVVESKEHADRLAPLAEKYDVELVVRPRDMLHPANDTGGLPIRWGCDKAMADARAKGEWYGLVASPFVVAPCKRPGLFDEMVAHYEAVINNPDWQKDYPCVMGLVPNPQGWWWQDRGPNTSAEMVLSNAGVQFNNTPSSYYGNLQHFVAASWSWFAFQDLVNTRAKVPGIGVYNVIPFPIRWWEDCHIDTEEEWEQAEWAFGKYIGDKNSAMERYVDYRKSWEGK